MICHGKSGCLEFALDSTERATAFCVSDFNEFLFLISRRTNMTKREWLHDCAIRYTGSNLRYKGSNFADGRNTRVLVKGFLVARTSSARSDPARAKIRKTAPSPRRISPYVLPYCTIRAVHYCHVHRSFKGISFRTPSEPQFSRKPNAYVGPLAR